MGVQFGLLGNAEVVISNKLVTDYDKWFIGRESIELDFIVDRDTFALIKKHLLLNLAWQIRNEEVRCIADRAIMLSKKPPLALCLKTYLHS